MLQFNTTLIFVLIIGIIIGVTATRILLSSLWRIGGKLVIDTTSEDKDIYTFHVSVPLEELPKHKVIRVCIEPIADKTGTSMKD